MYVGKELQSDINRKDYTELSLNLFLARKADLMHCDVRRKVNCMRLLIDWDLSADHGQKVTLDRDSSQCREAPANIQRQLDADTQKNGGRKRPLVEVDWDFSDDVAMLLEYMWEKAQSTGEKLH